MRLGKPRLPAPSPVTTTTATSDATLPGLIRLRIAAAALLIALIVDQARTSISLEILLAVLGPLSVIGSALVQRRLVARQLGRDRSAQVVGYAMVIIDMVATLAVLALIDADPGDTSLVVLAIPLAHAAVAFGPTVMTVGWLLASFAVMGWSLVTWNGMAQPLTDPMLTLSILWLVAFASGHVSAVLARRAGQFRSATDDLAMRSDVMTDLMQASMELSDHRGVAAEALKTQAERLSGGTAGVHQLNDPLPNRELITRAKQKNGAAVVGRETDGTVHIAISLDPRATRFLVLVCDAEIERFRIDALELLCLQFRALGQTSVTLQTNGESALTARRRRQSDPPAATLAEALDTSEISTTGVLESDAPAVELEAAPDLFELLGADGDALAEMLLAELP